MRTSTRRGLQIALVVGGAIFCSAQAQADDTTGIDSVLGGNQAIVSVEAPVTGAGNAVSVVGDTTTKDATTTVQPGSGDSHETGSTSSTSGADSVAGGNQVEAPVTAPVTVNGNAVSVIGDSHSQGATSTATGGGAGTGDASTSGVDSVLGGNQLLAPIAAPVGIGGNAVGVIGDAHSESSTTTSGGVTPVSPMDPTTTRVEDPTTPVDPTTPEDTTAPVGPTTPEDTTAPVSPTDPTSPVESTDPTTPGDGPGTVDDAVRDGSASSVTTMVAAASAPVMASMLAQTGATSAGCRKRARRPPRAE
ncbi:MAG TPA: chaplin family protein [Ornithinibacter sp.]|nr:chaplin family protein [Ornithinibacter sp.]